MPEGESFFSLF